MARVDYDAVEGLVRLVGVLDGFDPRTLDILASHIALEREIDVLLSRSLRRSAYVLSLGYAQKVRVFAALWGGEDIDAVNVFKVLMKFGELRNRVAHGNSDEIDHNLASLQLAYKELYPLEEEPSPADMAGGIISFFGDVPTPAEIQVMIDDIGRLDTASDTPSVE